MSPSMIDRIYNSLRPQILAVSVPKATALVSDRTFVRIRRNLILIRNINKKKSEGEQKRTDFPGGYKACQDEFLFADTRADRGRFTGTNQALVQHLSNDRIIILHTKLFALGLPSLAKRVKAKAPFARSYVISVRFVCARPVRMCPRARIDSVAFAWAGQFSLSTHTR